MTTILGPLPCRQCKGTVWVVRRLMSFVCRAHGPRSRVCTSESLTMTVVEASGERHLCAAASNR